MYVINSQILNSDHHTLIDDYTNIPYIIYVSCIHAQILSQNLNNNLDSYLRVPVFLFFLPLFYSGVIVHLGSHRMVCIVDLGDSNFY